MYGGILGLERILTDAYIVILKIYILEIMAALESSPSDGFYGRRDSYHGKRTYISKCIFSDIPYVIGTDILREGKCINSTYYIAVFKIIITVYKISSGTSALFRYGLFIIIRSPVVVRYLLFLTGDMNSSPLGFGSFLSPRSCLNTNHIEIGRDIITERFKGIAYVVISSADFLIIVDKIH